MITPEQNAVAMDELDVQYFVRDLYINPISHSDLLHKTVALIKCDRQLNAFEEHNRKMASIQRRDSIFLKMVKLWGTRK